MSFLLCSALFLYFELFSHSNGAAFWDDVVREATALSLNGEYHETLLAHEILGVDLGESEWNLHVINFIEFPLFLLICIPYLILAGCLLRRLIRHCSSREDAFILFIGVAGSLTMLPDYIIKIDFGRWVLATIVYYLVLMVVLPILRYSQFAEDMEILFCKIHREWKSAFLFVLFPVLLVPFWDVHINKMLTVLWSEINQVLHWW